MARSAAMEAYTDTRDPDWDLEIAAIDERTEGLTDHERELLAASFKTAVAGTAFADLTNDLADPRDLRKLEPKDRHALAEKIFDAAVTYGENATANLANHPRDPNASDFQNISERIALLQGTSTDQNAREHIVHQLKSVPEDDPTDPNYAHRWNMNDIIAGQIDRLIGNIRGAENHGQVRDTVVRLIDTTLEHLVRNANWEVSNPTYQLAEALQYPHSGPAQDYAKSLTFKLVASSADYQAADSGDNLNDPVDWAKLNANPEKAAAFEYATDALNRFLTQRIQDQMRDNPDFAQSQELQDWPRQIAQLSQEWGAQLGRHLNSLPESTVAAQENADVDIHEHDWNQRCLEDAAMAVAYSWNRRDQSSIAENLALQALIDLDEKTPLVYSAPPAFDPLTDQIAALSFHNNQSDRPRLHQLCDQLISEAANFRINPAATDYDRSDPAADPAKTAAFDLIGQTLVQQLQERLKATLGDHSNWQGKEIVAAHEARAESFGLEHGPSLAQALRDVGTPTADTAANPTDSWLEHRWLSPFFNSAAERIAENQHDHPADTAILAVQALVKMDQRLLDD